MDLNVNLSTGDYIGDTGAASLSESLKLNTTLTALYLGGEDKRRHTKDIHQQFTLFNFFSLHKQTTTLEIQEQHH